jgi:glutamate racemase
MLAPIKAADVDTLVLGCTHYPLLARTIADVMGPEVFLVSSAEETAFEVRISLASDPFVSTPADPGSADRVRFLTSGDVQTFRRLGTRFCGPEVNAVEAWSWS